MSTIPGTRRKPTHRARRTPADALADFIAHLNVLAEDGDPQHRVGDRFPAVQLDAAAPAETSSIPPLEVSAPKSAASHHGSRLFLPTSLTNGGI